jgi:hypothetical protein
MKTYRRSGGIAPRILRLGTRWKCQLHAPETPPLGNKPWYPLDKRLGRPKRTCLEAVAKRKYLIIAPAGN